MGGKSKSSQKTSNIQTTNNVVYDGDYAGVSGSVSIDKSQTDITHDYSQSTEEDYDYSQETDIEDSYNNDNSISLDDGSYFANGDISFIDAGALEAAQAIAETALLEATKQNKAATALSQSAISSNERSTRNALDANERTVGRAFNSMEFAIDEIEDIATVSVETVGQTSKEVIGELSDVSVSFADNLRAATQANFSVNEKALASVVDASTSDKSIIAELAKSTSLDGQDIVARSSEKMTMYMAVAAAVGFVAIAFIASKG